MRKKWKEELYYKLCVQARTITVAENTGLFWNETDLMDLNNAGGSCCMCDIAISSWKITNCILLVQVWFKHKKWLGSLLVVQLAVMGGIYPM